MRLILTVLVQLAANAIALVLAALLLDDLSLNAQGFLIAVGIFTALTAVVAPLVRRTARDRSRLLLGGSSLIASLVALIGTAILSDGIQVEGLTTWVLAAVALWGAGLLATFLLIRFVFTRLRDD